MNQFMDIEEVLKSASKIQMYKKEIDLNFEAFQKVFYQLNLSYRTDNCERSNEIQTDFMNKFKVMNKMYENDLEVLYKNAKSYNEIANLNAHLLDKME